MPPQLKQITAMIAQCNTQVWQRIAEDIAQIGVCGTHRRFVVTRMGFTGSTWLAKLLNSHPDVICFHEHVINRAFPRRSYDAEDIMDLVRLLAADDMHDSYAAAGDVGSVWMPHVFALRGKFATAVLMRHPARVLNTRLRVYPVDQSFSELSPWAAPALRELWDLDVTSLKPLEAIFLQDLLVFALHVDFLGKVDVVLRIEDLQDIEYCRAALGQLTGVVYDRDLVARAVGRHHNVHTRPGASIPEILGAFTSWQRHWYDTILGEAAPLLGYDLEQERTSTQPVPAGSR